MKLEEKFVEVFNAIKPEHGLWIFWMILTCFYDVFYIYNTILVSSFILLQKVYHIFFNITIRAGYYRIPSNFKIESNTF